MPAIGATDRSERCRDPGSSKRGKNCTRLYLPRQLGAEVHDKLSPRHVGVGLDGDPHMVPPLTGRHLGSGSVPLPAGPAARPDGAGRAPPRERWMAPRTRQMIATSCSYNNPLHSKSLLLHGMVLIVVDSVLNESLSNCSVGSGGVQLVELILCSLQRSAPNYQ